tara:strand:- start:246 stop:527 length:282 start_codon:yes stop_codon:yes gene_type:complete
MYISFTFVLSYLIGTFFKGKSKKLMIFSSIVILLTPAQIEIGTNNYAPAVFTFLFNSMLEQNYSLRVLRPIFLSFPISLFFLGLVFFFKKRFF